MLGSVFVFTALTFEWFDFLMDRADMPPQIFLYCILFFTLLTFERLDIVMGRANMFLQTMLGSKFHFTLITLKKFFMDTSCVIMQIRFPVEDFLAMFTFEFSFIVFQLNVATDGLLSLEILVTEVAFELEMDEPTEVALGPH